MLLACSAGCSWDSSWCTVESCFLFLQFSPHSWKWRGTCPSALMLVIAFKNGSVHGCTNPCLYVWWKVCCLWVISSPSCCLSCTTHDKTYHGLVIFLTLMSIFMNYMQESTGSCLVFSCMDWLQPLFYLWKENDPRCYMPV
jgi:hypothetical protein